MLTFPLVAAGTRALRIAEVPPSDDAPIGTTTRNSARPHISEAGSSAADPAIDSTFKAPCPADRTARGVAAAATAAIPC